MLSADVPRIENSSLVRLPTLGLGTTVQLFPFQCSMRVRAPMLPGAVPTAQTSAADAAYTAYSESPVPLFGLFTIFQEDPFQCSMSVRVLTPEKYSPTAQALSGEVAVTPYRLLSPVPVSGLVMCVQVLHAR